MGNSFFSFSLSQSLDHILEQPFYFLGRGMQAHAFVSEDKKYVIKFFKMNHLTQKKWLKFLPIPGLSRYRYKKTELREERLKRTFGAIRRAYDVLREETGLIFIHLNRSNNLQKQTCLIGRNGEELLVCLDEVPFIIQKRAELIYSYLSRLMEAKEKEKTIEALQSFLELIWTRGERGFIDIDNEISNNIGFVDGRAVQIDVAGLAFVEDKFKENPELPLIEFQKISNALEGWIKRYYPDFLSEYRLLLAEFSSLHNA